MIKNRLRGLAGLLGVATLGLTMVGQAQAITFTGDNGAGLSATAQFEIVGGNLQVTLTNTGSAAAVPSNGLTGVFFSSTLGTLTPVSALLNTGSTVLNTATQPTGGNVGGEWAYGSGLSGAPGGATQGISSSGLGLFGNANFNGPNLQGPAALDGIQYAIVNGLASNANSAMLSNQLISNSVVFTLSGSGLPTTLTAAMFSNISFQYGTSLTEPNVPSRSVPEPSSLLLLGAGLAGAGIWRRKLSKA